jgi:CRP-like cAMP-binding protein
MNETQSTPHFLEHLFQTNSLSSEEKQTVIASYEKVEFKKNDFLLKEGQIARSYFVIEEGLIRSFAIDTEGNDITTNFYSRLYIAMEATSMFMQIPSKEYIQALTDCTCWKLTHAQAQKLFHGFPAYREWGRAGLVKHLFAYKQRTLSMITDSAKDRYKQLLAAQPEVFHQAPLKHIATYLGITDTSLSRIRKEIARES